MLEKKHLKYYLMAIVANTFIGLLPIFWHLLQDVQSHVILMHRCFWTCTLLFPLVLITNPIKPLIKALQRDFLYLLFSSLLIGANWLTYIYAINHEHVLEASLAYFIAPIITIFLSFVFLKEKMSLLQKIAVAMAFTSILSLLIIKNIFPKFGLIIGASFSLYGLLGHKIHSSVISRICVESFFLTLLYFLLFQSPITFAQEFTHFSLSKICLFLLSGVFTIIPFILLNTSIKKLPYSTIGVLGFIVPILLFLIGAFYFHEVIDQHKLYTLLLILLSAGFYLASLFKRREAV